MFIRIFSSALELIKVWRLVTEPLAQSSVNSYEIAITPSMPKTFKHFPLVIKINLLLHTQLLPLPAMYYSRD
jgi:hypothetical protein